MPDQALQGLFDQPRKTHVSTAVEQEVERHVKRLTVPEKQLLELRVTGVVQAHELAVQERALGPKTPPNILSSPKEPKACPSRDNSLHRPRSN